MLESLAVELEEYIDIQKMMFGLNSESFKFVRFEIVNSNWFSGFDRIRELVIALMSIVRIRESLHEIMLEFVDGIEDQTLEMFCCTFCWRIVRFQRFFLYDLTKRDYYRLNEVVELIGGKDVGGSTF
jgi:hypothetical protein